MSTEAESQHVHVDHVAADLFVRQHAVHELLHCLVVEVVREHVKHVRVAQVDLALD